MQRLKRTKEIRIGITALAALGLFYFGFNYLKGSDIFKQSRVYYAIYNRVDGLTSSNPVMYKGFKVGRVEEVYVHPEQMSKLVVRFAIEDETLQIPKFSIARISSADLLGAKTIELELDDNKNMAVSGDTLVSDNERELGTIVEEKLRPFEKKLDRLLGDVDTVMTKVGTMLDESTETVGHVKGAFENLERTTKRMDDLLANEDAKLVAIITNVASITANIKSNNDKLTTIITNFSTISDSLAKADFAATMGKANRALTEVADIMEKVNNGEGSLGQLVENDSLYHNLEDASKDLDRLLIDIRENPRRYLHFSIFGRKK